MGTGYWYATGNDPGWKSAMLSMPYKLGQNTAQRSAGWTLGFRTPEDRIKELRRRLCPLCRDSVDEGMFACTDLTKLLSTTCGRNYNTDANKFEE